MAPATLPEAEVTRLDAYRIQRELPQLRFRVRQLRKAGWPLQAIADGLQTHRSTVLAWERHPHIASGGLLFVPQPPIVDPPVPILDLRAVPWGPVIHVGTLAPRLAQVDAGYLQRLSHLARRVRGHTPAGADSRLAAEQLNEHLLYHRSRGITIAELGEATTLTSRAVRTRLPDVLPPRPPVLDDASTDPLIVIWETNTGSRKWQTFLDPTTRKAFAFPAAIIDVSKMAVECHVLTLEAADRQLGWVRSEIIIYPYPSGSTV